MKNEIEHKFLVRIKNLPPLTEGVKITQGYISRNPVVRVRICENKDKTAWAVITIKGRGQRVRKEFEYRIPVPHALALLQLCGHRILKKVRYRIGNWEIDEFKGRHKGLWLAEIELKTKKSKVPELPDWIGKEVTYDPRYNNASLAEHD